MEDPRNNTRVGHADDSMGRRARRFMASAAMVESYKGRLAEERRRMELETVKNTFRNGTIAFEREHIVQVSEVVFEDEDLEKRLQYMATFFPPEEEIPFWLVPSSRIDSACSGSSSKDDLSSRTSSSASSLEGRSERNVTLIV
ncbi:hypothetical protein FVE85_4708 [Porphyridium purpureum]|uniref:Uncharacterized protein n=1 Tax=Porphyridium purpureum TaxID=35688 RepID=A0A5J4YQ06_PORPP|nr:hypothetical protein FVE85_4708 [Porphyridium purpureum]|eukprot:POR8780..scf236_6